MHLIRRWIPHILVLVILACVVCAGKDLGHYAAAREEYAAMDAALIREAVPDWEAIPEGDDSGADAQNTQNAQSDGQALAGADSQAVEGEGDAGDVTGEKDAAGKQNAYENLQIDYAGYAAINADFVGVLSCPMLDLRYPVVISSDNEEYLRTTFEGRSNSAGSIFMDYQNQRDWSDRNTYVYGHNMKDGSMFGSLQQLVQEDALPGGTVRDMAYENRADIDEREDEAADAGICTPDIYIYTPDRTLRYRIFCVEVVTPDADLGNIYRDSQYDIYISEIRKRAWYWDDSTDLSQRPNLLTLYTCYGDSHTRKLLVHAALIDA